MNDSLKKCVGCFLRYRSLPHEISPFPEKKIYSMGITPNVEIHDENDFLTFLDSYMQMIDFNKTGIMLSGGIDSVMLASYMPRGSYAFTIEYPEMEGVDEAERAKYYADKFGLKLIKVPVTFEDVLKYQDALMEAKGQPLATIEIGIYKISLEAKKYGLDSLLTGMGGDGLFGGFFNLLSKDWKNEEFVKRFTYVEPSLVMKKPIDTLSFFEKYYGQPFYNMNGFLDDIESEYTLSYFLNPTQTAGIKLLSPYEHCIRKFEIDRETFKVGLEKILLRKSFYKHCGFEFEGRKFAFPRPTEYWLKLYDEKLDDMFFEDSYNRLKTPEQKWVLFTTNHFVKLNKK